MLIQSIFHLLILVNCISVGNASKKGVKVTLSATWQPTPILHEAAEFLADESEEAFYQFARSFTPPSTANDDLCTDVILAQASKHLTPSMSNVLKYSLTLRQYSPRLETFRSLAEEEPLPAGPSLCCWASVGASKHDRVIVSDPKLLKTAILNMTKQQHTSFFPFDHVIGNTLDNTSIPVILYGPIGSPCSRSMDEEIQRVLDYSSDVVYAWRPTSFNTSCSMCLATGTTDPNLTLHGYGVELAIKNMEYNARDDNGKTPKSPTSANQGDDSATLTPNNHNDDEGDEEEVSGFRFSTLLKRRPELRQQLIIFRDNLISAASEGSILKVWDVKDLGLQATQRVVSATDPLRLLGEVAQNFPLLVESLSKSAVTNQLRDSAGALSQKLPPHNEFMLINGVPYDIIELNLYTFMEHLRKEVRLLETLTSQAGLSPEQAREAAMLRGLNTMHHRSSNPRLYFTPNADFDEVVWITDVENDLEFKSFPKSLVSLLQPSFMGQIPTVRRNVFTAILVFDPVSPDAIEAGLSIQTIIEQRWPIRIGIIPVFDASVGDNERVAKAARMFAGISAVHGGRAALEYLYRCGSSVNIKEMNAKSARDFATVLLPHAEKAFKEVWTAARKGKRKHDKEDALTAEKALDQMSRGHGVVNEAAQRLLGAATAATKRAGIALPSTGFSVKSLFIFNGFVQRLTAANNNWRSVIGNVWQSELQLVAQDVYLGRLVDESTNVYEDILRIRDSLPRYNPRVIPSPPRSRREIRSDTDDDGSSTSSRHVMLVGPHAGADAIAALPVHYFGPSSKSFNDVQKEYDDTDENRQREDILSSSSPGGSKITHWVIIDATSLVGLQLAVDALRYDSDLSRIGIIINPSSSALSNVETLAIASTLSYDCCNKTASMSKADVLEMFTALVREIKQPNFKNETIYETLLGSERVSEGVWALVQALTDYEMIASAAMRYKAFLRDGLNIDAGVNAVVTNGRVLIVDSPGDVVAEDFKLIDIGASRHMFTSTMLDDENKAAIVSSILTGFQPDELTINAKLLVQLIDEFRSTPLFVSTSPRASNPAADASSVVSTPRLLIQAVLNPLSKTTQQVAAVFSSLRSSGISLDIEVLLNPVVGYSEMPLKTFYRYVVPYTTNASAVFATLPSLKTLTLGMDVPEGWLVEPVSAKYDLDNLRLEELSPDERYAEARFELESLMIYGMCIDETAMKAKVWDLLHPRGVQLQLGTSTDPAHVDTLVMSNLGYFQLKAAPGIWALRLATGRSQELFEIVAGGEPGSILPVARDGGSVPVAVTSFGDLDIFLMVKKDPNRLEEDVLDVDASSSMRSRMTGGSLHTPTHPKLWNSKNKNDDDDTIHVFTVASGHMYERLQKIMILSAIKRTKKRIKFWFIKNYMSPTMKRFVPLMAKQYGFDYEFVTYKWPSWLNKQTEKQRIIWAYKILFLDVLFPLNLKKVIFCDSDQVIRADLNELWTMDLQGAPYGYTPFCDNNADMEGFRFWKQGFWKEHLRGKPYHISALYVIDLDRFRAMAAGDRLRVIYDSLSKDPNSLSNLDQDLPNYAQDSVPIFSLPQEWLWCETWCGEATRPKAKTIDLCNNPLTKEPKLQSARRIISEWPDLNREVEEFTEAVEAVFNGVINEEELSALDGIRFKTYLEPMTEGSVRTRGGYVHSGNPTDTSPSPNDHTEL